MVFWGQILLCCCPHTLEQTPTWDPHCPFLVHAWKASKSKPGFQVHGSLQALNTTLIHPLFCWVPWKALYKLLVLLFCPMFHIPLKCPPVINGKTVTTIKQFLYLLINFLHVSTGILDHSSFAMISRFLRLEDLLSITHVFSSHHRFSISISWPLWLYVWDHCLVGRSNAAQGQVFLQTAWCFPVESQYSPLNNINNAIYFDKVACPIG